MGIVIIGVDYIDIELFDEWNIVFSSVFGCNVVVVVEYVISSLYVLS